MKSVLVCLSFLFTFQSAQAVSSRFLCQVVKPEQGKKASFSFALQNIGTAQVDYLWPKGEMQGPFRATHGTAKIVEFGVPNGYVAHQKKSLDLVLMADDGVSVAAVYLYRNSGYQKGYIKAKFGTVGGGGFYSKVFCRLSPTHLK